MMDQPADLPERFVFIVTYGRSGSTLLQNLLNAIPGYQIRGENNNALFHLFKAWQAIERAESLRAMRESGMPSDQTHPWYGGELIDLDEVGQALVQGFVRSILKPAPDVRVSGFKEIRFHAHPNVFSLYLDFIHRYFPNARFVFNTRDHAAVTRSGWWAKMPSDKVVRLLSKTDALFDDYAKAHPDRGFRMHYDDYVADRSTLQPMYEFLNEEMDEELIQQVFSKKLIHSHRVVKS